MIPHDKRAVLSQKIDLALGRLLVFNLNRVGHQLARFTNRELAKLGYPLQMEQLPVLVIAYFSEQELPTQQEIANLLQRNKAGILRSVRSLERDGYLRIVDDAADRRKNLIALTPAGRLVVEKIMESAALLDGQITNQLTEEENKTLMKLLRKVSSVLED